MSVLNMRVRFLLASAAGQWGLYGVYHTSTRVCICPSSHRRVSPSFIIFNGPVEISLTHYATNKFKRWSNNRKQQIWNCWTSGQEGERLEHYLVLLPFTSLYVCVCVSWNCIYHIIISSPDFYFKNSFMRAHQHRKPLLYYCRFTLVVQFVHN